MTEQDLQNEVNRVADGLLASGIVPTLSMIEARIPGGKYQLLASLETWVLSVGESMSDDKRPPTGQSGVNLLVKMPRESRSDAMSQTARTAGAEAAEQKASERRETHFHELVAEISKARSALERLEAREREGDTAASLAAQLEKTRARLAQMEEALRKSRGPDGAS
ncbi:MAG TPA: hypothetical protein VMZ90_06420 [Vicinamibacterales bacterium]|nr:hypothetical protein [Vicinamibacterales bacterium]